MIQGRFIKTAAVLACALLMISVSSPSPGPDLRQGLFPESAVIIRGGQMPSLAGTQISALLLAAMRDGQLRAVPFQVDEVREGEHVFTWVSPLGRQKGFSDHDTDNGRLDADDELVFMAGDLGPRARSVKEAGAEKAVELAVTDPASGKTAYAYLLLKSRLTPSRDDYVKMDISGGKLHVETSRYQFSQPADRGYFDELRVLTAQGDFSKNLVIRNQTPARIKVKLIGIAGEKDFYDLIRGETIATKDGPIRALWRCAGGADFGGFKIKGEGGTEQHYYANRMDQPVIMDIPFDFNFMLSSFDIRGVMLLNPQVRPLTYYDISHRAGVKIDGVPDAKDGPLFGQEPRDWCVLSGNGLSVYFITHFPEAWDPKLKRVSFVDDGPARSVAGSEFGEMVDLLSKGTHVYMVRYYIVPEDFKWGMEKEIEDMAGQKLTVSCQAMP